MNSTAAVTFVFNEGFNLPIWIQYYGAQVGRKNLYVLDRGSTDGSTTDLKEVNVIQVPRHPFDEDAKTHLMSKFHSSLTSCYDQVIMTDCDELLVPDPQYFCNLSEYLDKFAQDYVNAIGIDVIHVLTEDLPLDNSRPVLSQRTFGRFHSPECKQLISKSPIRWLPGLHSSNKPPSFDNQLFLMHIKLIDYAAAVQRQQVNLQTVWSSKSLDANYGAHHRFSLEQFVHQSFLVPLDIINRKQVGDFDFSVEIMSIKNETVRDAQGHFRLPMNISKFVRIPERFVNSVPA